MKIKEVNTYLVRPRWCFVEIVTDEGLCGLVRILNVAEDLGYTLRTKHRTFSPSQPSV